MFYVMIYIRHLLLKERQLVCGCITHNVIKSRIISECNIFASNLNLLLTEKLHTTSVQLPREANNDLLTELTELRVVSDQMLITRFPS